MRTTADRLESYFASLYPNEQARFEYSRKAAQGLGLEKISLSDYELKILKTVLKVHRPSKFIEIGTLTGTSGMAILSGLPDESQFWTMELNPHHAELARPFLEAEAKGRNQKVHLVVGDAREKLIELEADGPFDGIFIDGNKAAYGDYLAWAEINIRKGGLIIADNVFLGGAVFGEPNPRFSEKQVGILRKFNERLSDPKLFESCLIPTSEGLSISLKLF